MVNNMASSSHNSNGLSEKRPRSRKSVGYLPSPDDGAAAFDKENLNIDATTALDLRPSITIAKSLSKRPRSRSLGPGGLDALREDAGNRRQVFLRQHCEFLLYIGSMLMNTKAAAMAAPKSILKPSIPLSPLKDIPARKSGALPGQTESRSGSPRKVVTKPQKNVTSKIVADVREKSSPLKTEKRSPTRLQYEAADTEDRRQPSQSDVADDEAKKARTEAFKQRDLRRKAMGTYMLSLSISYI